MDKGRRTFLKLLSLTPVVYLVSRLKPETTDKPPESVSVTPPKPTVTSNMQGGHWTLTYQVKSWEYKLVDGTTVHITATEPMYLYV